MWTRIGHGIILTASIAMAAWASSRQNADMLEAKAAFIRDHQAQARLVQEQVHDHFRGIYQELRTISSLPGIRAISDPYVGLDPNSRQAIQTLYRDLSANINVSEVYVVQKVIDPDAVFQSDGSNRVPLQMFDDQITSLNTHARHGASHSDEIEIEEYRELNKEMVWFAQNNPNSHSFIENQIPMIISPELTICDNTVFDQTHDEKDRKGIIFSVPFYSQDGDFGGTISAIVRSRVISNLLLSNNFALVNMVQNLVLEAETFGQEDLSMDYVRRGQSDPSLIYSAAEPLDLYDRQGKWALWSGASNQDFKTSAKVREITTAFYSQLGVIAALATVFSLLLWQIKRNERLRETVLKVRAQRRLEGELVAAERRWNAALESGHQGVWDYDLRNETIFYSRIWYQQLGIEPDDIRDLAPMALPLVHEEDRAALHEAFMLHLRGETEFYECEYRMRHKQGHWIWIGDRGKVISYDEAGEPVRMIGTHTDISARREAESAVRLAQERWNFALEGAGIGVWDVDFVTGKRWASDQLTNMLGRQPEEYYERSDQWLHWVHPEDRATILNQDRLQLEQGEPAISAEIRMQHKDGRWIWIMDRGRVVQWDKDGKPLRMSGIHADISRIKEIEAELRNANVQVEAAMRAKTDFLANMTHELRTPLTGIIGAADLLLESIKELPPGMAQIVQVQKAAGQGLLRLINDILDYSKIGAGHMALDHVALDLRHVIESHVSILTPQAREKAISLTTHISQDVPETILGDSARLGQILLNFLSNAVKFTQNGGSVTVRAQGLPDKHLRISVTDTGIGIGQDKIALLFNRFSQADTSISRRYGGTGLGLAISQKLVELMQGRVEVESELGVGSTFSIILPYKEAATPAKVISPAVQNSEVESRPLRVLVAEDTATNRMLIEKMLSRRGQQVVTVENGREAVQAILEAELGTFDLVLMDIQMPEMDGLTATHAVRASLGRSLPIIALTANTDAQDIYRCFAAGVDGYLPKPVHWQNLFAVMERAVQRVASKNERETAGSDALIDYVRVAVLAQELGENRLDTIMRLCVDDLLSRLEAVAAYPLRDNETASGLLLEMARIAEGFGLVGLARMLTFRPIEAKGDVHYLMLLEAQIRDIAGTIDSLRLVA